MRHSTGVWSDAWIDNGDQDKCAKISAVALEPGLEVEKVANRIFNVFLETFLLVWDNLPIIRDDGDAAERRLLMQLYS